MIPRYALLLLVAAAAQAASQDVLTVGGTPCVSAIPGQIVTVPVYIRDVAGTPLGVDQPPDRRIEEFNFRVRTDPVDAIVTSSNGNLQVTISPAGVTAPLSVTTQALFLSPTTFACRLGFYGSGNRIPFHLNASPPGDLVAQLRFAIKSSAKPKTISLMVEGNAAVTVLTNQAGFPGESVFNGDLSVVNGCISVAYPTISLSSNAVSLGVGQTSSQTVTISAPSSVDVAVSLSSSNSAVAAVPVSVTVPAGSSTATFVITGMSPGSATVTAALPASLGGGTASAMQPSRLPEALHLRNSASPFSPDF